MFLEPNILHFKLTQCVFVTFMTVLSVPLHHKYRLYCTDISSFIWYQSCSTVLIVYTAICWQYELIVQFHSSQWHRPCVWPVNCWLRNPKLDVTWYHLKPSRNYTHTLHSEMQYRWGPRYKWLCGSNIISYSKKFIKLDGCGRYLEQLGG
jgi:hypothetical protein